MLKLNTERWVRVAKVAGIYALLSSLWIIYSDHFLYSLGLDATTLTYLQTYKGLAFVTLSSLLIGFLVWRELKNQAHLMRQLSHSHTQLDRITHEDTLTGLPNRQFLLDQIEAALLRAKAWDSLVGVLVMDLDGFKHFNESHGHAAGDRLLVQVSRRLRARMGDSCLIGRLGGDEFLLLAETHTRPRAIYQLADRLLGVLREPFDLEGQQVWLTTSVGVCLWPDQADTAEELLRNADAALYHAKGKGRDRFSRYSGQMINQAQQYLSLDSALRCALEANCQGLEVWYQPLVSLVSGRCIGVEALLRWHDGQRWVPPDEFIPHAEVSGLIHALGDWVLERALQDFGHLQTQGFALESLAVNLSSYQLSQPHLLQQVMNHLQTSGVAAEKLELEMTESALISQGDQVLHLLEALRQRGVRLAIDDFGTGYSSLAYLKRLPVSKLKIDRSFVTSLPQDQLGGEIVAAVISMGRALGLEVLAEGIETPEQRLFLAAQACHSGQGFLFARPMPLDKLETWLATEAETCMPLGYDQPW